MRRTDGVTAESEEFVVGADVAQVEYTLPEGDQRADQFSLGPNRGDLWRGRMSCWA